MHVPGIIEFFKQDGSVSDRLRLFALNAPGFVRNIVDVWPMLYSTTILYA